MRYLIYNKDDYDGEIPKLASELNKSVGVTLIEISQLSFVNNGNGKSALFDGYELKDVHCVINLTGDYTISRFFERNGARVFNNARTTELCYNRVEAEGIMTKSGIGSLYTEKYNRRMFNPSNVGMEFPMYVKSAFGRGEDGIYLVHNLHDLNHKLDRLKCSDFILQRFYLNTLGSLKVFVMQKEIIASVKKSDYTHPVRFSVYGLNPAQINSIRKVINLIDADLICLDFSIKGTDSGDELFLVGFSEVIGNDSLKGLYGFSLDYHYSNLISSECELLKGRE